tara:strand:- start:769 stop:1209 length:441 start_codon:yes stop_codon:yes gene_type:complete
MATINLTFFHELNVSVQIGDIVYFIPTTPVGPNRAWESTTTPHMTNDRENILMIGPVTNITIIPPEFDPLTQQMTPLTSIIEADFDDVLAAQYGRPSTRDFIMFSKDNKVNLSSLLGYYSLAKFRNNSTEKAELFSIGADFVESSK